MKVRLSSGARTALKILLSAGALAFVFTRIDTGKVADIYGRSDFPELFLAVVLFAISKLLAAFRLNLYFRRSGVNISGRENLKLYLLGMFYNLFLPGGIGGDGYKIYYLGRKTGTRKRRILQAVVFDRLSGMLALFCLAVILSLFINPDISFRYKRLVWILIPLSAGIFYFIQHRFFSEISKIFLNTTLLSFAVQSVQTLSAFVIFLAIGGSGQTGGYLFIFLLSSIVAMLPFTIGGIGSRELTFLFGAHLMHLDVNTSIAMSLMFYLITAFVSFWGIFFSMGSRKPEPGKSRDEMA